MVSRKKSSCEGDGDRINHLPDEVLCHILSFTPTIYSVPTCVLSKRWEHLWKYVPELTFNFRLASSQQARFANFVNNVLSVHTAKVKVLEKFSLTCNQINQLPDATKWINSSVLRNIRSLHLNIDHRGQSRFVLPNCIFNCKTLESLMLEGNILFIVPSQVCLPKLRTLKLDRLEYQNDPLTLTSLSPSLELLHIVQYASMGGHFVIDPNRQMLSSTLRHIKLSNIFATKYIMVPSNVFTFQTVEKLILQGSFFICGLPATICMPNLTSLELVDVRYQDDQIFSTLISSCTSLESLNVDDSIMEADELNISSCTLKVIELKLIGRSSTGHKLVLNAPALKYLKVNVVGGLIYYQIEELASLEQADVRIDFDRGISHDYCSSSLMDIYIALVHVKSLKVQHNFPRGCGFGHALPIFTRLTELDINIYSYKCGVLLDFINNSTKLENLTLNGLCGFRWGNPYIVPVCLLTSVKTVTITNFRGGGGATRMTKYLIGKARILEKMEVCFAPFSYQKKEFKKITSFWRESEKCVVLIK